MNTPRIFCALDTADLTQATQWAKTIGPITKALKVGMEFVNSFGPQGIEAIQEACPEAALFIDLKFHDIPNTVAGAIKTTCDRFDPAYLNVHASGGQEMMQAAKDSCGSKTKLLAVTILTSLSEEDIRAVGYRDSLRERAIQMAELAKNSGLDGVVCSSQEIEYIRKSCGPDFELMVPGIRPSGTDAQDQKRVMTPKQAIHLSATHLVIGRPITKADDPAQAAHDILESLQ